MTSGAALSAPTAATRAAPATAAVITRHVPAITVNNHCLKYYFHDMVDCAEPGDDGPPMPTVSKRTQHH